MLEIRFAHAVVRYAARNDGDDEPNARSIEPEGRRTPPLCFKKKNTAFIWIHLNPFNTHECTQIHTNPHVPAHVDWDGL